MVDYSKWDKLVISDSEEDSNSGDEGGPPFGSSGQNANIFEMLRGGMGMGGGKTTPKSSSSAPSPYLKWAPGDTGEGLPPAFFTDPHKFVPQIEPETGKISETWGIPIQEHLEAIFMKRKFMVYQYMSTDFGLPEVQFVRILAKKKEKQLASPEHQKVKKSLAKRDFILHISLETIEPKIWRKFKVSANTNLFTFQDKVVGPIMGWARNYHGYTFSDLKDGTVYGPDGDLSTYIDSMHKDTHGWHFLNDKSYVLSDILQNVGDEMSYCYDLGDSWAHTIVLEEILDENKSDAKIEVLDGAMNCPPEDSSGIDGMGNYNYAEFLKKKKINLREAGGAINHNVSRFNPYRFSVAECQQRVHDAVHSKASTQKGKQVYMNFKGSSSVESDTMDSIGRRIGKHEKVVKTPTGAGPYMTETVSTRKRDSSAVALCNSCGSPNDLKVCGKCKTVRYCSRSCQVSDWKYHKADCVH